jgi:hypothetical protein
LRNHIEYFFGGIMYPKRGVMPQLMLAILCPVCAAVAQLPQPDSGTIERGTLPARWLSQQPKCMEIP